MTIFMLVSPTEQFCPKITLIRSNVCVCEGRIYTVDVYNQGICIFPDNFSEYVYYLNGPAYIRIH